METVVSLQEIFRLTQLHLYSSEEGQRSPPHGRTIYQVDEQSFPAFVDYMRWSETPPLWYLPP